jgi:hypothetical protein
VENQFPGNRKQPPAVEPKKVSRVVEGRVVRRKQPMGRRFTQLFVAGDTTSVRQYVLMDVAIPALKDLFSDMVTQGFERLIYGESRPSTRRPGATSNYVSYNRFSNPTQATRVGMPPRDNNPAGRPISREARSSHNFDEIIIDTRHEAEEVLAQLFDMLTRYESVSIADLYDLVGVDRNFTDEKWGWTNMAGASVSRVRSGGYVLNLPKPEQID